MYRPLAPPAHQRTPITGRQSSRHSGNSGRCRRGSISIRTAAHTLLLSKELCHVALPKGTGLASVVGVCIGAEEVGDDLDVLPEETLKKGGFGAGGVDGPRSSRSAWARGQANITLRAYGVAHQKCRVSRRRRNEGRCGRGLIMFCARALVTVTPAHPSTRSPVIRIRTGPVPLAFVVHQVLFSSFLTACEGLRAPEYGTTSDSGICATACGPELSGNTGTRNVHRLFTCWSSQLLDWLRALTTAPYLYLRDGPSDLAQIYVERQ